MNLVFKWIAISLSIMATPYLIDGIHVQSFGVALGAALLLAVLNIVLKPLLILFTLPLTVLTLGLFIVVINAICFHLTASFVTGLSVDGFTQSILASLVVSAVSWVFNLQFQKQGGRTRIHVQRGGGFQTNHRSQRRSEENIKDVTPPH